MTTENSTAGFAKTTLVTSKWLQRSQRKLGRTLEVAPELCDATPARARGVRKSIIGDVPFTCRVTARTDKEECGDVHILTNLASPSA